jgi:hypothetical protein
VDDDGARLTESELQVLHGPYYEEPQDGETEHARRRCMSRMRSRGHWARAHASRAGAPSAERDGASSTLPRVAKLPLRADVQLAERRQQLADELREECRQWSMLFDAINLNVPQLEWHAWNKRLRNAINRKKHADQAVSAERARAPTGSSAQRADLGAAAGTLTAPPAYAAKLEEHTTYAGWLVPRRRQRRHLA